MKKTIVYKNKDNGIIVTKKSHNCIACNKRIRSNSQAIRQVFYAEYGTFAHYWCLECSELKENNWIDTKEGKELQKNIFKTIYNIVKGEEIHIEEVRYHLREMMRGLDQYIDFDEIYNNNVAHYNLFDIAIYRLIKHGLLVSNHGKTVQITLNGLKYWENKYCKN